MSLYFITSVPFALCFVFITSIPCSGDRFSMYLVTLLFSILFFLSLSIIMPLDTIPSFEEAIVLLMRLSTSVSLLVIVHQGLHRFVDTSEVPLKSLFLNSLPHVISSPNESIASLANAKVALRKYSDPFLSFVFAQ